uniref:Uncharacterized protein n=1 Tax=Timema tahoe TaxID=61484 RepID=A0A7R9IPJ1_9NEOP|nr:unnamed protein product [Timema tahoe]
MEGQNVCTRKAKPVKPHAITGIFNTMFSLDAIDAKRIIVCMNVKENFTPFVRLEKCGGSCVVCNRTEWEELGDNKSGTVWLSSTKDETPNLNGVAYLAPTRARLCEVWDLVDVTVERRDMWSTPLTRYCNDLIDKLVVDVCDSLAGSEDVIDLEQPMMETSVDDVDMYTGMLSEIPVEGGVLGPTVSCLITDQFLRLKFGDRFWYETPQQPQAFTPGNVSRRFRNSTTAHPIKTATRKELTEPTQVRAVTVRGRGVIEHSKVFEKGNDSSQLDEIRKTTLAGLICDTSDSVEQLQPYVMRSTKSDNTPVKCSSVPHPNLSLWKEMDGEFVKTGSTHLKLGASAAIPQVIKAVPKTIRIGARVTGGSVTMSSGTWKPTFPVTIPVSPFDAIATSDEVPSVEAPTYGHSIVWRGTLSEISPSGDLTISATFSLPKYVHGTNLFFIEWLNGNIQLQLNTIWNATGKSLLPKTGLFSSSIHFKDTWKYSYLKDVDPWLFEPSLSLKNDFSANPNVVFEPKIGCAVIILLGSYSSDRSLFLWSGDLTLVLSPATEELAMPASSKLFVKQSNVNSLTDAIPSTTRVVAAVTGGSVSTSSGSWTSTFPVGIPVLSIQRCSFLIYSRCTSRHHTPSVWSWNNLARNSVEAFLE